MMGLWKSGPLFLTRVSSSSLSLSHDFLKNHKWGGQNVSCDLGGGNVLESAPSKSGLGGLRKWDWSGLCPFPPRKNDRA